MKVMKGIAIANSTSEVKEYLTSINIKPSETNLESIRISSSEPSYAALLEFLKGKRIEYQIEQDLIEYEKADILANELSSISVISSNYIGFPEPQDDFWKAIKESHSESSMCPKCQRGLSQDKPIRISTKKKLRDDAYYSIWWLDALMVSKALMEKMKDAAFTGVEYWPMVDYRSGVVLENFFQVLTTSVVDGSLLPSSLVLPENQTVCECGKMNYFKRRGSLLEYMREEVSIRSDIARTKEWFSLTSGKIIVSRRFCEFYFSCGLKGLVFEPVVMRDY